MFNTIRQFFSNNKYKTEHRVIFLVMLVGAVLALVASLVLSIEAIYLASHQNAVLPCDINSVLSCGTVARHETAQVLGFPNAFIGLMTLPVMVTIAVIGLAGVRLPRWFMIGAQIGATLGVLFAVWMLYVSFVVIQALCPWCLATDLGMIAVFFALTRYNLRENNIALSGQLKQRAKVFLDNQYDIVLAVGLVVVVLAAIVLKYGSALFA